MVCWDCSPFVLPTKWPEKTGKQKIKEELHWMLLGFAGHIAHLTKHLIPRFATLVGLPFPWARHCQRSAPIHMQVLPLTHRVRPHQWWNQEQNPERKIQVMRWDFDDDRGPSKLTWQPVLVPWVFVPCWQSHVTSRVQPRILTQAEGWMSMWHAHWKYANMHVKYKCIVHTSTNT